MTAKIQIGWDANSINAVRVAEIAGCGIAALAVHGRTGAQGYSGEADWRVIGELVAEGVTIPVIGNGDLFSAQEVVRRRTETKIAGVMIGRAAMSAMDFPPDQILSGNRRAVPAPALSERWNVIIEHCRRHADDWEQRNKPSVPCAHA